MARQFGVKQVYAKVRYLQERNNLTDWQAIGSDYFALMQAVGNAPALTPISATNARSLFMGDNPNYDVSLVALSLGAKW